MKLILVMALQGLWFRVRADLPLKLVNFMQDYLGKHSRTRSGGSRSIPG